MKTFKSALFFFFLLSLSLEAWAEVQKINSDWRFILKDIPNAKLFDFNDSDWSHLNLPHDWAFENGYSEDGAQTDRGGYAMGGIGWYRKELKFSKKELEDKYYFLDFDAVYMNSEVWINGNYLGKRPYGYISFGYEITKFLKAGENMISVRVDNSKEPSARWYHGCGIYGNVHLRTEQRVYFEKWETFVTTPDISDEKAVVDIVTKIIGKEKREKVKIIAQIIGGGKYEKSFVAENGVTSLNFKIDLKSPQLWSPEQPHLYTINLKLISTSGKILDENQIRFGVRSVRWNGKTGFHLNGKQVKLRGVCEHLEGGPVGAAWTEKLMRWKIQLLKDMGCNSIRTAHNPQLPMFYDLCDEIGIMVMDEVFDGWMKKAAFDYGYQAFSEWWERDLRDFIRRDRNHPCVVIYSVGNETRGPIGEKLVSVCHEEDSTRLVTSGHAGSDFMDVLGVNGHSEKKSYIENYNPTEKAFVGTETPHTWQVRGYYRSKTWYRDGYKANALYWIPDLTEEEIFTYSWTAPTLLKNRKQIFNSSYDNATVRLTARHNLEVLRDLDWYSGHYRWTGFDYLGEAGYVHGGWPFRAFMGGVLDLAGFKKDHYYLYQSEWTDKDMVHILPHWTHPRMKVGTKIPIWVYTTGDEVELIVNGKSMGRKSKGLDWNKMQCEWLVPWNTGVVEAIAYRAGKEIARAVQKSSGAPVKLKLITDTDDLKADGDDVAIVTFEQQDAQGVMYPYGENRIYTKLFGDAYVLSMENGSPVDTECNFNADSKRAFFGLLRAFIKSKGDDGDISLFSGLISGDKALTLSNLISIDTKEIALRGKLSKRNIKIYYTTDSTEPSRQSMEYTRPFTIKIGTTIRAKVYDGDNELLSMTELFAENEGLYWGDGKVNVDMTIGEQAEEAKLFKAKVVKKGKAYKGKGFVSIVEKGGSISWYQENDGSNEVKRMYIRYAQQLDSHSEIEMELRNNEKLIKIIRFKNTGDVNSTWVELPVNLKIHSGANNIQLISITDKAPCIDQIRFE